jgi:phytoene/squalene synthetase
MDVVGDIRAPDEATLDTYCNRVASAVGRLSVRVFGMQEHDGIALAHHLGRALQLTNILRDLDEDAAFGRLYLPAQALREAGIVTTDPRSVLESPALGPVCARVVASARGHFAQADKIMARSARRSVRAPRIMSEAYRLILDSLVARGWSQPRRPIHLPRSRLLWIIMRHAFI